MSTIHETELKCSSCGSAEFAYLGAKTDQGDAPIHAYTCLNCDVITLLTVLIDTVGESTSSEYAN